jgi:nitrite reductase/ring-hydroxylating ferredoxin subunit
MIQNRQGEEMEMKFLKRIFGICETPLPADPACWTYADREIRLHLDRTPELDRPGGAVRLEDQGLPVRTLVVHGLDGTFHAFGNRCTHMGRRIDPLAGADRIECCSVSKSTFTYAGEPIGGAARKPLKVFPVTASGNELKIAVP